MKKLKFHLPFYCMFLGSIFIKMNAQQNSINWSMPQEPMKAAQVNDLKLMKSDDQFIYFYCYTNYPLLAREINDFRSDLQHPIFFLIRHDKSTGKNQNFTIDLKDKNKKMKLLSYSYGNNKFHLFTYFHNKQDKKIYIFHESYDIDKQCSNNDVNKITEIDLSKDIVMSFDERNIFVNYINNRYLLRYSLKTTKGKFFGLELFDEKLQSEWSNPVMAETEAGYNFESDYTIDKKGNVYALQRNYENKTDISKHYEKSRVWAVYYPKGGGLPKSMVVLLKDDNFITSVQLSLNEKDQPVCAGLYAKRGTSSAVGCFSFLIEPQLEKIIAVSTQAFTQTLITKGMSDKMKNEALKNILKEKEFDEDFAYITDSIHYRKDGSFTLIAQKYKRVISITGSRYIHSSNLSLNNINQRKDYYFYDDLIVMTYNADGSIRWVQKIPKYSYVIDMDHMLGNYFVSYDKDENMNLIFNITNEDDIIFSFIREAKTVMVTLDKDGNEKFRELESNSEIANTICPNFCIQHDNTISLTRYDYLNHKMYLGYKYNRVTFGDIKLN